jgi:hypothetical protein
MRAVDARSCAELHEGWSEDNRTERNAPGALGDGEAVTRQIYDLPSQERHAGNLGGRITVRIRPQTAIR